MKNILKYKDLKILGQGAQSTVWSGTGEDNVEVAIKVVFGDEKLVEAEEQLKNYMPDYLKNKKQISEIFYSESKKFMKGIENYYKYMIVFNSNEANNIIENLFNYDFIQKGWKLTIEEIFEIFMKIMNKRTVDLNKVCTFLNNSSAQKKHLWTLFKKKAKNLK